MSTWWGEIIKTYRERHGAEKALGVLKLLAAFVVFLVVLLLIIPRTRELIIDWALSKIPTPTPTSTQVPTSFTPTADTRIDDIRAEIEKLKLQNSKLQDQINDLHGHIQRTKDEIIELQRQLLSASGADRPSIQAQLDRVEAQLADQEQQIGDLTDELNAVRDQLNALLKQAGTPGGNDYPTVPRPITTAPKNPNGSDAPPPDPNSGGGSGTVISNCPEYYRTGVGVSEWVGINVKEDQIAFVDTWEFDDNRGGFLVTITGPYSGRHKLTDGSVCNGIPSDADYGPVRQQRLDQLKQPYSVLNLP